MQASKPADMLDVDVPVVDVDIHQNWKSAEEIAKYLPRRYKTHGVRVPNLLHVPSFGRPIRDDVEAEGEIAADPEALADQHLNPNGVDFGILTGPARMTMGALNNRDYAVELARAYNKWVLNDWLAEDDRLGGAILIAPTNPEGSAELIDEFGSEDQFVQVQWLGHPGLTMGHTNHWPIYEAAEDADLPISVHPAIDTEGNLPMTAAGNESSFFEYAVNVPLPYIAHLTSLVKEGVFQEFPDLKFAWTEMGFEWLPWFMWRLDDHWKAHRGDAPWVDRRPSESILERVRFTTQPMILPDSLEHFFHMLDMIDAENTLMYSSDFPHYDGDDIDTIEIYIPDDIKENVLHHNAAEFYNLPQRI